MDAQENILQISFMSTFFSMNRESIVVGRKAAEYVQREAMVFSRSGSLGKKKIIFEYCEESRRRMCCIPGSVLRSY